MKMAELDRESVDLIITDLSGNLNMRYIGELRRVLKLPANMFVFFPIEDHQELLALLNECDFKYKKKPYIWHIRGEDTYQTFLWVSRNLAEPPRGLKEFSSTTRDKHHVHGLDKSQGLLASLITNTTAKGDLVIDPICYGPTLAMTCIELGRVCSCYCPSRTIQEQGMLNLEKSHE
jgi:hypothetical protein